MAGCPSHQAQESAARLQHAIGFAERGIDPRHVADPKGDGVRVKGAVGKRQRFRIALDERDLLVEMARGSPVAAG